MAYQEPEQTSRPERTREVLGDFVDVATDAAAASGVPGTATARRGSAWYRFTRLRGRPSNLWILLASVGPGLIAANAGNDAGGIATYAQVGATYGYRLLWMFPLILISLAVTQEMAARMGAATGKGLSDLIRENFSIQTTALVMLALLIANGGTVVSEFVGIATSLELLHSGLQYIALPLIAAAIWLMLVGGSYRSVEKVFLAMTLVFFAYPISAVLAHPDWGSALHHTAIPTVQPSSSYLFLFVATVGTSITPYMQVYVQSAVVDKGITPRGYKAERYEVYGASLFANLIAVFIVIATAATLYGHHHVINTAADAAQALRPVAGPHAEILFATGLFGASMLAAAVLPLATAYSITEVLGVEKGLNAGWRDAPIFTGLFTGLMALGVIVALILSTQQVIQVLLVIQVIDCLLLPFILFSMLQLVNNQRLMGNLANGPIYNVIARATAVVVTLLSLTYVVTTLLSAVGINL